MTTAFIGRSDEPPKMTKYLITATRTSEYEIEVEAEDEEYALAWISDWIADDFEEHITQNAWDFEVSVNE
jgi:hypothetical protein